MSLYISPGHVPHPDPHREAGPEQEPAVRAAGIFRPAPLSPPPGPVLQPAEPPARVVRPAQEPQVAGPEEQPSGARAGAGGRALRQCVRVRHVRKEGQEQTISI